MRLLIIEDEVKLALSLKRGFSQNGFAVDLIHDGQEGLDEIEINHDDYDLIVLDINLPNKNGFEICESVRKQKITTPIIMLTAKDTTSDKVQGLNSGADDYLVKPFEFAELTARVNSLLRRPRNICHMKIKVKDLTLDPSAKRVWRGNNEIRLTAKEFAILEYLLRNLGKVISREQILSHIWDQSFDSFSNVIDVHIANLKKKIDNPKYEKLIQSVRGSGYRINS